MGIEGGSNNNELQNQEINQANNEQIEQNQAEHQRSGSELEGNSTIDNEGERKQIEGKDDATESQEDEASKLDNDDKIEDELSQENQSDMDMSEQQLDNQNVIEGENSLTDGSIGNEKEEVDSLDAEDTIEDVNDKDGFEEESVNSSDALDDYDTIESDDDKESDSEKNKDDDAPLDTDDKIEDDKEIDKSENSDDEESTKPKESDDVDKEIDRSDEVDDGERESDKSEGSEHGEDGSKKPEEIDDADKEIDRSDEVDDSKGESDKLEDTEASKESDVVEKTEKPEETEDVAEESDKPEGIAGATEEAKEAEEVKETEDGNDKSKDIMENDGKPTENMEEGTGLKERLDKIKDDAYESRDSEGNMSPETKEQLVDDMKKAYDETPKEERGNTLVPEKSEYLKDPPIAENRETGDRYDDVNYDWPSNGGFEGKPEEVTPAVGDKFDRVGAENGRYVAPLEGDTPQPVENRALPYHFTEDNITEEPSYHAYEVDRNFGELQDAINEYNNPELAPEENDFMRGEFQKEYDRNNWPSGEYTHEPGKTYSGDIAEAFGSGGGTQLELPMSVESLKELGMIHEL